jgi:hypothetical protein
MLAARLLHDADLTSHVWLVEPIPTPAPEATQPAGVGRPVRSATAGTSPVAASQPDRNPIVPGPAPTPEVPVGTFEPTWGSVTPG